MLAWELQAAQPLPLPPPPPLVPTLLHRRRRSLPPQALLPASSHTIMEVCVGDVIEPHASDSVLRGHGTQLRDGALVASRCGQVQRWNQLVLVQPLSGGYSPAVGHMVVGRIAQVCVWRGEEHTAQ